MRAEVLTGQPLVVAEYYLGHMSGQQEISQRDPRSRSEEIVDSVEHGHAFIVTRDGHQIGELIPLRRRRTFVSREQFLADRASAGPVDPDRLRADVDAPIDNEVLDPYDR